MEMRIAGESASRTAGIGVREQRMEEAHDSHEAEIGMQEVELASGIVFCYFGPQYDPETGLGIYCGFVGETQDYNNRIFDLFQESYPDPEGTCWGDIEESEVTRAICPSHPKWV